MPLPVTEDTPPDMLAGAMDIKVLLPSGRTVSMSVERSTPMMDLLVQLTTVHKLSLAGHTTVALSDSGYPLHHLSSTPLGALDTRLIQVAPRTTTLKRAPARPNNVQPFTTTFRLQVHLPRNQLFVTRVSPDTRLADILRLACSEKNLDPDKYELRHPANLCECLSLSHTLADYRLQEVTLVASRPPGTPLTPADIMALQREEEKRRQQVKKTGGIYSIIFNKRNKGIPEGSGSVSSDSLNGRSISPARSDESMERSVSPPAPAPPLRPGRKRRPAPKPPAPSPTDTTITNLKNTKTDTGVDSGKEGSTTLSHSRTSSDSSGYHEASVLSESPDTRTNSSADTLPRRSKLPSTNHIVAKNKSSTLQHGTSNGGNHNLSRSLSNLTAVGINAQNMHSASTSSLASQGMMPRKKKAAPPPPAAPVKQSDTKPIPQDSYNKTKETSKPTEIVAALLHDIKTFDQNSTVSNQDNSSIDKRVPDLDKNIHKPVQIVPKLDDILDEEEIVLDLTTTKRNSVPKFENTIQTSSIESNESFVQEPSLDVASSRLEHPATPITSPDLVTSAIVHSPPPAVQELTKSRPRPKPRVLERSQPQPLPRQTPPSGQEDKAEALAAATYTDLDLIEEIDKITGVDNTAPKVVKMEPKQRKVLASNDIESMASKVLDYGSLGRTFGVGQTMLVLSDAASMTPSARSSISNKSYLSENASHGPTDRVELDIDDELEMFEMPSERSQVESNFNFLNEPEETSRFSDLDFETSSLSSSMSGLGKMSLDNEVIDLPSSSEIMTQTKLMGGHMGSVTSLQSLKEMKRDPMGSVTSLRSLKELKQNPMGSVTSLRSLKELKQDPMGSVTSLRSLKELKQDLMGSVTSLRSLKEVKRDPMGSVTSLRSRKEMKQDPIGSVSSLNSLGELSVDSIGSATSLTILEKVKRGPLASVTSLKSLEKENVDTLRSVASLKSLDEQDFLNTGKSNMGRWPNMDDLVSPKPSFRLGDQDEEEDEGVQIGIPPTIETVLRDNDLGGTSSPDIEEVPEWQYHLPAPPSAFRDLHSPTTTEFETVVLADANVFQELPPDNQTKGQNKYKPIEKIDNTNLSSTNRVQDVATRDNGVRNETRSTTTSLENSHGSPISKSSLDNDKKHVKEMGDVAVSKTVLNSESDWEPQTIAIVNNVSKAKPKFNNGDLRLRQDGVTKEVYKVNPIFDNQHFEDNVTKIEGVVPAKVQLDEHDVYNNKNSINRVSNTDLQLSNQLKNFTISTYNKPQNIDSIFSEEQTDSGFKKPFAPSTVVSVARTNSYSKMEKDRPATSVKRSTSYVSLARPYAKPSTFQSISRTKSISSLVREEDSGSSLRKSTSDANLNQVEDVPLQSLQVLKAILPRLSQSQILYETGSESQDTHEPQAPKNTTTQHTHTNPEVESKALAANTQETPLETSVCSSQESKTEEVPKSEPRPFVYLGPPAINFSTWSERPKVQVSLKSDRDYRMGKQSVTTNANSSQTNAQQTRKETPKDTISKNNIDNSVSSTITNVVNKVTTQNKPTVVNGTEEKSSKIEPIPLTMRIVSHTSSNYRNKTSLVGNGDQISDVAMQEKVSSRTDVQEERLPIVRAVELKKSRPQSFVQLRNMSTTHLNGSSSNNNVANVPVNYQQGTFYNRHSYIENGMGRNVGPVITNGSSALPKSSSTSQINIELPDNNFNQSKLVSNGGKKYTSVIGINGSGAGSAKIIQHSASVQNLQPSTQLPRSQSLRQNFSTVKVNSFSGPKPMPIVKGFRFAGTEAANFDHGPVKISIEQEKEEKLTNKHGSKTSTGTTNGMQFDSKATKQPLKTINGVENFKAKSKVSHMFGDKVQQKSSFVLDQPDGNGRVGNNIPEPPKLPVMVFKKPTQRPPVSRFTNPRDELMDAIKNFGGRETLKPSKQKTQTNVILTI